MLRTIQDCEGTKLSQFLYSSPHNNDVFFYYKGIDQNTSDDLQDVSESEQKLQVAFLKLEINEGHQNFLR